MWRRISRLLRWEAAQKVRDDAAAGAARRAKEAADQAARAAGDAETEDGTAKRSQDAFALLDKLTGLDSAQIIHDAIERGASAPEDFAKAIHGAAPKLTKVMAEALGQDIAANSRLRAHAASSAARREKECVKIATVRREKLRDSLFFAVLAAALLIAPWRIHHDRDAAGYSLIFWQRVYHAEIDPTRYLIQVFAVSAICGVAYLKMRRNRKDN